MKTTYTTAELDNAALSDILNDARCAELQAESGPFYPERGITAESLRAYAAKCRQGSELYATGGAHNFVLKG